MRPSGDFSGDRDATSLAVLSARRAIADVAGCPSDAELLYARFAAAGCGSPADLGRAWLAVAGAGGGGAVA
jgi:hypothetical protein